MLPQPALAASAHMDRSLHVASSPPCPMAESVLPLILVPSHDGVRNTRELQCPALEPGFGAHKLLSAAAPARGMAPEQGAISRGGLALPAPGWAARVCWQGWRQRPGMLMQQIRTSRKGEDILDLLMLCQLPSPSQGNTPWKPPQQSWGWGFPALSAPQQLWVASTPVHSQLSLSKTCSDEGFPAVPGGMWRRIRVG